MTESDIAAAIVVLKARSVHFPLPAQVQEHPFDEKKGWRLAAIAFIEQNLEQGRKGQPITI